MTPHVATKTVAEVLNRQIADWTVLYVKLHHHHWYVKGEQFFTLHGKFEELYNEAAEHIDELAERLLAIGGQPVSSMRQCLEVSGVNEASGTETASQMVQSVIDDFSRMIRELKDGMALAGQEGDESTGDMLLAIHSGLEKHLWMLRAFLGK